MSLGGEHSTTILSVGGAEYAFEKLKRWKAEGPTQRNRDVVRFLIGYGHLSPGRASMLINLALEWGDFAIWEMIQRSASGGHTPQLSSDVAIRAWGAFTFDRTRRALVCSVLAPMLSLTFLVVQYPFVESRRPFTTNPAQGPRSSLSSPSKRVPLSKTKIRRHG